MYALYVESSHARGMGHLFREINIYWYLRSKCIDSVVFVNDDPDSLSVLNERDIKYMIVDGAQSVVDAIRAFHIDICIIDRFASDAILCRELSKTGILLVGIDDSGDGAEYFDIHFCGMLFNQTRGKKVYTGKEYIILNPEIKYNRRIRTDLENILVTLGGTDSYGVTIKVVKILWEKGISADIVIGPGFKHRKELDELILQLCEAGAETTCECGVVEHIKNTPKFELLEAVPSLIKLMREYDLAVTGGGVTCLEASASGLPCVIIANELHEIEIGEYVSSFGGAIFAGYYKDIDESVFDHLDRMNLEHMSNCALEAFRLDGIDNIFRIINSIRNEYGEVE